MDAISVINSLPSTVGNLIDNKFKKVDFQNINMEKKQQILDILHENNELPEGIKIKEVISKKDLKKAIETDETLSIGAIIETTYSLQKK